MFEREKYDCHIMDICIQDHDEHNKFIRTEIHIVFLSQNVV